MSKPRTRPQWDWYWKDSLLALPFWSTKIVDLSPFNRQFSIVTGTPVFTHSRLGSCVDFDDATGYSTPIILLGSNPSFTMGAIVEADAFGSSNNQDTILIQGLNNQGFTLELDDDKLRARILSQNTVTVGTLTVGVTYRAIFTFNDSKNTGRLIVKGSDGFFENILNTGITVAFSDSSGTTRIGLDSGGIDTFDGRIYQIFLKRGEASEKQMMDWIHDPFGPFRRPQSFVGFEPSGELPFFETQQGATEIQLVW